MVLYIKHDNSVVQYTIITQRGGCFYVEIPITGEEILYEHIFYSAQDLITNYTLKKEDLCTKLERPCLYKMEWEIKENEIDLQVCVSVEEKEKAEVWKGMCGKTLVSLKTLKPISKPREALIEEIEVLKRLQHRNVITFHGYFFGKESISIVTEFLNCNNLVEYLKGGKILQSPILLSIIRQVINGLNHLQQHNVVHCDFGARNVLVAEAPSLQCKVTNFRMAKRIDTRYKVTSEGIAIKWSAPEMFKASTLHINSDVWSFGIFLYEIVTACERPYPGMTDVEVVDMIKAGDRMRCPPKCHDQLYTLMQECWNENPVERPSFESLVERMKLFAATMTVDGRPVPATRRNIPQQTRPIPKPRKMRMPEYANAPLPPKQPHSPPQGVLPKPPRSRYENSPLPPRPVRVPPPPSIPTLPRLNRPPVPPALRKEPSVLSPLMPPRLPPPRTSYSRLRELEIKRREVKLVSKIRENFWDEIWEGVWKQNTNVSVTLPKPDNYQPSEVIEQIEIMKKLQNPNIIKLYGISTTENPIYILTDLMKPGSLLKFLRDSKDSLENDMLLQISVEVARGMAYLHTHYIIHRDIRADNILIGENNVCKITGLNLIKKVDETTHTFNGSSDEKIPIKWAAPEVITHHTFSTRSDIWSFGIFLYEVVTNGNIPYPGFSNQNVVDKIKTYRMPCPEGCPVEVHEIMMECWEEKPDSRPSSVIIPQMLRDLTEHDDEETESIEECYVDVFGDNDILLIKEWDVDFSDFTLKKKLQQGKYGEVWQGVFKEEMPVAIKCVDVESMSNDVENRIELIKQLQHSNILELHSICATEKTVHIIIEFMQHGNLVHYLQNDGNSLNVEVLGSMSLQCSRGMAYLEEKGIIHGNLTGHKVMVGEKQICKITGICGDDVAQEDPYDGTLTFYIPSKWMAPETALNSNFQQQSDIWSFGVLLYEIMTHGQGPYPEMTDEEALDNIARGYRMACPTDCPQEVYDIMLECWNDDPSMRPSFEKIAERLEELYMYEDPEMMILNIDVSPIESDEKLTVKASDISMQYQLAESKTGEIWKGTLKGMNVAIKILRKFEVSAELQNIELIKNLENPHILRMFGVCSKNKSVCVVMQLMNCGNLQDYIAWEGSSLSFEKLISISIQCASGMAFLGDQDTIHGNLTARNVLVGEKLSCKIKGVTGGGIESEDPYSGDVTFHIPYKWMPLEAVLYNEFNELSDIWSFGILLYEIMTYGQTPYPGMTSEEAISRVREGYRMPCPPDCPTDVYNIMLQCWNESPSKRPAFQNITRRLEDLCAYESIPTEEEWPWDIPERDISRTSKITDSNSGEVWKGTIKGITEVAIKCSTHDSVGTELAQADLMKALKHPHILKCIGVCSKKESVWVAMELMSNGNLKNFIRREGNALTIEQLVSWSIHCASGMAYLEEHDIVHGNLTARQILVGEDLSCKITGICGGGVEHEDPYEGAVTFFLPIKWSAPETTLYREFSKESDVWSFGILLYEIMSYGRDPYSGMTNAAALEEIQKGSRMECPPNCPREVGNIMLDCWKEAPDMRPRFVTVTMRLKNQYRYMRECVDDVPSTVKQSWEVEKSELHLEHKLRDGENGEIWKGLFRQTVPVAIQILSERHNVRMEVIQKLKHPHVLCIKAICNTPDSTWIITEFMYNDNLVNYLRGDGRSLKLNQLTLMAVQISSGMIYLKEQGIIHKELAARNILVGKDLTCKITGISGDKTDIDEDPYNPSTVITIPIKWTAPEAVLYTRFTTESDVWSFGIVLYEIITYGRFPYPGMTNMEVTIKIQEGYRLPRPTNCPDPVYDLMKLCWKEDPSERCSFERLNKELQEISDQLSGEKDEWEIEPSQISFENEVGVSGFGEVLWKGVFNNELVIVKCHSPERVTLTEFLREAEILKTLDHPHVIKLLGMCSKGEKVFIVTNFMEHVALLGHVRAVGCTMSIATLMGMAAQVANGMVCLQKQRIIHRQLSASNIMVGNNLTCKIANFSQALVKKVPGIVVRETKTETIRWMPVEVIADNQYSMKSDVWSFGVILYELATWGQTPYREMSDQDMCQNVKVGYRMPSPPICPTELFEVMQQCWEEEPDKRPSFTLLQENLEKFVTHDKEWVTQETQVSKVQKVGTGRFGDVWKGKWSNIEVAIKCMKPGTCSPELFLWEAEIMKSLDHPCVLKLHALCSQAERIFIVTELIGSRLLEVLRQKSHTLKLPDLIQMSIYVTNGMIYLQSLGIIHRDIAARSILVGKNNICKVSDFSDAILDKIVLTPAQKNKKLPIRWAAPESALYKQFSMKSDVWSFGILLYEVVNRGEFPYSNIKDPKEVVKKLKEGYRMPCTSECPPEMYKIMLDCWNKESENRPTFQTLHSNLKTILDSMKWEVEAGQITWSRKVGTGRFGEVWEGEYKEMTVAVKCHKPMSTMPDEFLWEAEIMKTLNHPNVIQLLGVCTKGDKIFMVTEFMEHGTLLDYLKGFGRTLRLRALMIMAAQVASGMAYLQTQSIIHRDLAARSILVGESNVCKVSDFSEAQSSTRDDNPDHKGRNIPIKWLPPEAVVYQQFSVQTDIWSYGILLHEIVTGGSTPYPRMKQDEALKEIQSGYRMPCPSGCPQDIYNVMVECWREEPSARPTFETVHLQVQRISETCRDVPLVRTKSAAVNELKVERKPRSSSDAVPPAFDRWELDRSMVRLFEKYEEGRFGVVWKGYLRGDELVAVKMPKRDRTTLSEFLHESEIMKTLQHPNVISLRGVCTKGQPIYIVTEFMTHSNMIKYLRGTGRKTAMPQFIKWAGQICNGMTYLEQCHIIHRDVAARNVLVDEQLVCKVSDFGLAQKITGSTYKESSRTQFPLKWMAPEAIANKSFSFKSDVWAFGILLHEMVTHGALPYPGVPNADVAELVKAGYRMPCPRGCPKKLHEIMMECWKEKPDDRPNFTAVGLKINSVRVTA